MKIFLSILLSTFTLHYAFAQSETVLKISDQANRPIKFASIKIMAEPKDGKVATYTSGESGTLTIKLIERNNWIVISCIGYKDTTLLLNYEVKFKEIQLRENHTSLSEVIVNYKTPLIERKIDRTVFNLESSISSIGSNSFDVLEKIPGVRIVNDAISLSGKSTIMVTLDNKPIQLSASDLTNFLRSLSSDQISKIEIITNPPASFDAQGNAGIINIVTKHSKKPGFNGSVRYSNRISKYDYSDYGAAVNANIGKFSITANVGKGEGPMQILQNVDIYYPDQTWKQRSDRKQNLNYSSVNLWLDYKLSEKNILGFNYIYSGSHPDMIEGISNTVFEKNNLIDSVLTTKANTIRDKKYNSYNLHLNSKLDSLGRTLALNFDYLSYLDESHRGFTNETFVGDLSSNNKQVLTNAYQDIDIYTLKADLELPLKIVNLSGGGKLTFTRNNSSTDLYNLTNTNMVVDSNQLNKFIYKENIQALYINAKKVIKKWEFQAGLRGEWTETNGNSLLANQTNRTNYFRLFPTLYSSLKLDENNLFVATYGRRIGRPTYEYLNPFKWYTSPYTYYEGNPFLTPSFTDNFELVHSYKSWLNSNLYYSRTSHDIDQIAVAEGKILAYQYQSIVNSYSFGLIESITFNPVNWLEVYNQLQPYYRQTKFSSSLAPQSQSSWSAFFSTSSTFSINKENLTAISLGFWWQLPEVNGIYKYKSYGNASLGFKRAFFNKKLITAVNSNDIFKMLIQNYGGTINGLPLKFSNYNDSRRITVSLSYKFGSEKLKSNNSKNGNEDEKRRLIQ